MEYYQILKETRINKGMDIKSAAYLSNVTEPTIRALEAGGGTVGNLIRYCKTLGLSLQFYANPSKIDSPVVFT